MRSLIYRDYKKMNFDNNENSVKESLINYKDLTYEAFRNIIYKVLKKTSTNGLPGKHHFFISFKTDNIGTSIPENLKKIYQEEMTIVIQNAYWNFTVYEDYFKITLLFSGIKKQLKIPFDAITGFNDPEANFNLKFPVFNKKKKKINKIKKNIVSIKEFKKEKNH